MAAPWMGGEIAPAPPQASGEQMAATTATLLSDGSVLVTGGVNDTGVSAAAELWRP